MPQKTRTRVPRTPSPTDRRESRQELLPIDLPKPKLREGRSLPESLRRRKTVREISDKKLSLQMVSNLLWAACGVNRPRGPFGTPGITAASASNSQEIDVYVAVVDGVYRFDAHHHRLLPVVAGDLRSMAIGRGQKDMVTSAPIQLLYIADIHKLSHTSGFQEPGLQDPDVQKSYFCVDTGLIAGNVYLFAASQGLATWFHNCDKIGLARKLNLRADQRVLFGQTVGYPERT